MSVDCEQNIAIAPDFKRIKTELAIWAKIKRFPLHATYELTPLCNLRCPMCYVRLDAACMAAQGKQISAEEWLEIGRQSAEMGTLFVTLTGGEPLLHPHFWEIYNGLTEMGLLININSNGCLINEEVVERFKNNPPHNLKISIYGASDETYEKMCGVKDGFTRVSRAIDLLKAAELNFFCTTTMVRENMKDIPAIYRYAFEKKIKYFHTSAVTLSSRGALSDPLRSRASANEEGWTLARLEKEKRSRDLRPFAYCGGYGTSYFMTWHGHMQFCAFTNKPYVQMEGSKRLSDVWQEMLEKNDAIKTPAECADCPHVEFCKRCPGLLASESGDPEKVSETFCAVATDLHRLYDELKAKEAQPGAEEATASSDGE